MGLMVAVAAEDWSRRSFSTGLGVVDNEYADTQILRVKLYSLSIAIESAVVAQSLD